MRKTFIPLISGFIRTGENCIWFSASHNYTSRLIMLNYPCEGTSLFSWSFMLNVHAPARGPQWEPRVVFHLMGRWTWLKPTLDLVLGIPVVVVRLRQNCDMAREKLSILTALCWQQSIQYHIVIHSGKDIEISKHLSSVLVWSVWNKFLPHSISECIQRKWTYRY